MTIMELILLAAKIALALGIGVVGAMCVVLIRDELPAYASDLKDWYYQWRAEMIRAKSNDKFFSDLCKEQGLKVNYYV